MQHTVKSILVLGAGSFGSCLADHLGDSDHHVYLWSRSKEFCDYFNQHFRSIHQLKDHQFSTHITAVGPEFPHRALIDKIDVLLFAIPTEGVRYVFVQPGTVFAGAANNKSSRSNLAGLKPALNYDRLPLMIFVNKGIEASTQCMTLEIIADELGPEAAKAATFLVSHTCGEVSMVLILTSSPGRRLQKKVRFQLRFKRADEDHRSHPSPTHLRVHRIINTRAGAKSSGGFSPAMVPLVRPLVCAQVVPDPQFLQVILAMIPLGLSWRVR